MPQGPFEEARHNLAPSPTEREVFVEDFASRGKVAVERRSLLVKTLGLASGVLGVVLAFPLLRSLGPLPKTTLRKTAWRKGAYLVDVTGRKIRPADIEAGGFITVFPPDDIGGAYSQTMLIHVNQPTRLLDAPAPVRQAARDLGSAGFHRVLEGVHARRLPSRALPRANREDALPLPPVAV